MFSDLKVFSIPNLSLSTGTDFEPHTKARSDKFAAKEGLPYLEYLLHPRTTGKQKRPVVPKVIPISKYFISLLKNYFHRPIIKLLLGPRPSSNSSA